MRGRSSHCVVCGENAMLTQQNFQNFDYECFTQSPMSDRVICSSCRHILTRYGIIQLDILLNIAFYVSVKQSQLISVYSQSNCHVIIHHFAILYLVFLVLASFYSVVSSPFMCYFEYCLSWWHRSVQKPPYCMCNCMLNTEPHQHSNEKCLWYMCLEILSIFCIYAWKSFLSWV